MYCTCEWCILKQLVRDGKRWVLSSLLIHNASKQIMTSCVDFLSPYLFTTHCITKKEHCTWKKKGFHNPHLPITQGKRIVWFQQCQVYWQKIFTVPMLILNWILIYFMSNIGQELFSGKELRKASPWKQSCWTTNETILQISIPTS